MGEFVFVLDCRYLLQPVKVLKFKITAVSASVLCGEDKLAPTGFASL